MIVTLGEVIEASKTGDILGISDRTKIINYVKRAVEIASYKANWNPWIGTIDIACDCNGIVTLPSFVGTVLACNVGGQPTQFRNAWFQYHMNGPGSCACGNSTSFTWIDNEWTPTFENVADWSLIAAIIEDQADGVGDKFLRVFGDTTDDKFNEKAVIHSVSSTESEPGVMVPLLNGYASTDARATFFKRITRVQKPQTKGYVKLIAFKPGQLTNAKTIGYYGPDETEPRYRRIKVGTSCQWVRIRYRKSDINLKYDFDIVPIASLQATLDLLKAIRLRETNNIDVAELYEQKAVQLITEIQNIEDGPAYFNFQVEPGMTVGTIDFR